MHILPLSEEGARRIVESERLVLPEAGQEVWLAGGRLVKASSHPPGLPYLILGTGHDSDDLRRYIQIARGPKKKK